MPLKLNNKKIGLAKNIAINLTKVNVLEKYEDNKLNDNWYYWW